jgi:hypothetical protein
MSIAKPQAVPIGLSRISAVSGSIADLLRQIVDRRAEPAVDDDRVGAPAGVQKRRQQGVAVVADRRSPAHRQADILQLLGDVAEVGVDDLAGQHLVAGADDLDQHLGHAMKLSRSPGSGQSIAASWPEADSVM